MDTPATLAATEAGLEYEVVVIERVHSAEEAAVARGIDLAQLVKTIVTRRAADDYLFVLVPGDRAIDWPKLRQTLGVSRLSLPDADEAKRVTGYERGTITPFGSLTPWPVYMDERLIEHDLISIGGGAHGVAIHAHPDRIRETIAAVVGDYTKEAEDE